MSVSSILAWFTEFQESQGYTHKEALSWKVNKQTTLALGTLRQESCREARLGYHMSRYL